MNQELTSHFILQNAQSYFLFIFSLGILLLVPKKFKDENVLNTLNTLPQPGLQAFRVMREHYSQSHLCQLCWRLPAAHSTCFFQGLTLSFQHSHRFVIYLKHQFQLAIWMLLKPQYSLCVPYHPRPLLILHGSACGS